MNFPYRTFLLLLVSLAFATPLEVVPGTVIRYASAAEGGEILATEDDHLLALSPFDRAARLGSSTAVTQETYRAFLRDQGRDWTAAERARLDGLLERIAHLFLPYALNLPAEVVMVKTTGLEEGQAAYTRQNAIMLPASMLEGSDGLLEHILTHEFFHVLTRHNPEMVDALYSIIGFEPCSFTFPSEIADFKISNPDAPSHRHSIRLTANGEEVAGVPVLLAREVYSRTRGGTFFDYMDVWFVAVRLEDGVCLPLYNGRMPRLLMPSRVEGFFEQIGRNTDYTIHPEEILADNFVLMVQNVPDLPNPEIIESLREIFSR